MNVFGIAIDGETATFHAIDVEHGWLNAKTFNRLLGGQQQYDYILLVSEGTVLPTFLPKTITQAIARFNREWPNWGIASGDGVAPFGVGPSADGEVRFSAEKFADAYIGPNFAHHILPGYVLEGNLLLLNARALRDSALNLPKFEDPNYLEIYLSLETLKHGKALLIAPQLASLVPSRDGKKAQLGADMELRKYLANSLDVAEFRTPYGTLAVSPALRDSEQATVSQLPNPLFAALNYAAVGRRKRSVLIVTRTLFGREPMLKRNITSVKNFITHAGQATAFSHRLFSSIQPGRANPWHGVPTTYVDCGDATDTRFLLVQAAAQQQADDFFWFVDDDDWLFNEHAASLGVLLSVVPENTLVFIGSQVFSFGDTAPGEESEDRPPMSLHVS